MPSPQSFPEERKVTGMETSNTIGKIAEALAKAQAQMKPAVFDASNPHFKSKYATLAAIMEVARPALTANGIAVIQGTSVDGEPPRVQVTMVLVHVSGEWIRETLSIKPARDDAQSVGSAISYARRYALSALVGIVADEDDDGEAAVGRSNNGSNGSNGIAATPVRKLAEVKKPKVEVAKGEANKDENPKTVESKPEGDKPKGNTRVGKIREIFRLSTQSGETPDQMKVRIGHLIGLKRAIRESAEIKDDQLDLIIESFRKSLGEQQAKKEVA